MTADLIQRLRTCSTEERRAVAMKLAKSGSDETVTELVRIADGGEFTQPQGFRKHWYSLHLTYPYSAESTVKTQLMAIEALGETRNKKALDYLTYLAEWRIVEGQMEHCLGVIQVQANIQCNSQTLEVV